MILLLIQNKNAAYNVLLITILHSKGFLIISVMFFIKCLLVNNRNVTTNEAMHRNNTSRLKSYYTNNFEIKQILLAYDIFE